MFRRVICVLFAGAVVLSLGLSVLAVEETGSIRVTLQSSGRALKSGSVTLYRAGDPVSGGYRLEDSFGGGFVPEEDACSAALAGWLAEQAEMGGTPRILDADGSAEFSGLEDGLYLLVQSENVAGYYPIQAFLVTIPYGGQQNVEAFPKVEKVPGENPKTGQHPAPIIAAMGLVFSGVGLFLCVDSRRKK